MKRSFSIALIFILLLNVFGYYGVFLCLRLKNERSMVKAIESNLYLESDLVTLEIPVSLPYMADQEDFERVWGKFEWKTDLYRLVKQKYANGTLTVVCVKDVEHRKLNEVLSEYAHATTDNDGQPKSSKVLINFLREYVPLVLSMNTCSKGWSTTLNYNSCCETTVNSFSPSISQPPEIA